MIRAIEDYRARLELDGPSMDISARRLLIDEFLSKIYDGLGEPVQIAYTLYLKYLEMVHMSSGFEEATLLFEMMADEAGYLVDYFEIHEEVHV